MKQKTTSSTLHKRITFKKAPHDINNFPDFLSDIPRKHRLLHNLDQYKVKSPGLDRSSKTTPQKAFTKTGILQRSVQLQKEEASKNPISDKLGEQISKTTDELDEQISKTTDKLDEQISKTTDELDEQISKTTDKLDEQISKTTDELDEQISKTTDELDEQISKTTDKLDEQISKTTDELDEQISKTTDELDEQISKTTDKLDEQISKTTDELDEQISKTTDELDEQISKTTDKLDEQISKTTDKLDEQISKITDELDTINRENKISQMPSQIQGMVELKPPTKKDSPFLLLTYDFTKIPDGFRLSHNHGLLKHSYYRYKNMLIKAQHHVRLRQTAKALDYYVTIRSQDIPPELDLMIETNMRDITNFLNNYLQAS